jgi:hypothetical protein
LILLVWAHGPVAPLASKKRGRDNARQKLRVGALAGDEHARGGLRRFKTETASTLAFGRGIARTYSQRPVGRKAAGGFYAVSAM